MSDAPESRPRGDEPTPRADVASLAGSARRASSPRTLTRTDASPPARAPRDRLPPGTTLGQYEIIRRLGQGGMGTVYLARDTRLGRLAALKLLRKRGDVGAKRFLVEARAIARCRHENIVVIYEVGEHAGAPYLALEYVEGPTLRGWMRRRARAHVAGEGEGAGAAPRRVPPAQAVELMVPVVRALACAHAEGIVHRDLKPENILLADSGPVKVVDFGIAKKLGAAGAGAGRSSLRERSSVRGTLLYMAPEQRRGEAVDGRADLWAVGLMLYELCAGEHPLTAERLAEVADPDAPLPPLGERLPEVGALGEVVDRCLRKRREERFASAAELLAALEALASGRGVTASDPDACPFAGLSAFQEGDAGRFFGRGADVASALALLREQPLLAVLGASGAGKSSFVRAGVIPALKRSEERWEAFALRPGRRPLAALAGLIARLWSETLGRAGRAGEPAELEIIAALRERPGYLGAELRARCRSRGGRWLLFVDQFEELYTLGAEASERAAFFACLEGAADEASSPVRVALALRSDFLDRVTEERKLSAEFTRGLVLLAPPGRPALREALVRPLEASGHRFESEALVGRMLDALEGARCPLPLLQFTATKLWEARDRNRCLLTEASYERLGGVEGALVTHADATLEGLSTPELRLVRTIAQRLVTPERTRAVVGVDELRGLARAGGEEQVAAFERVVGRLVDARLLALEGGGGRDDATLELVHESLVERWPRLGRWLDESAQDAPFLARLRAAAQPWEAGGEAEGLLWREGAALEARVWYERRRATQAGERAALGEREERYLKAVVALSERAQRRRWRVVAALVAALGVIAATVSYLAVRARSEAAHAQDEARRARNAARMAAAREKQADPTTVLTLLRELEPPGLPRDWSVLADGARRQGVASAVLPHVDLISLGVFSPDGQRIASSSADHTLRIWRTDGVGEPLILRGHEDWLFGVAWSPDNQRIASASRDKTIRVWNADGSGEPLVLRGHEEPVTAVAFSPDGRRLASASGDRTVRVWPADGVGEPLVLRGHEHSVRKAAWSPDGRRLVSASLDRTVRVWDADGGSEVLILRGHDDLIYWAEFSPDGQRIVSASRDKTIRIWRADGAGEPLVLRGHEGPVSSAAFSPDGRYVVSASADKTLRRWRADGAGESSVVGRHEDWVHTATLSPDGRRVVSASADRTLRVWHLERVGRPVALRGHQHEVSRVAWSADGHRIVTGSEDQTVRLWNADSGVEPLTLRAHSEAITSVTLSLDGRRLLTSSGDRTTRAWSVDGEEAKPLALRRDAHAVHMAAISPDGRLAVSALGDGTARVWKVDGGEELLTLRGHEGDVSAVAFRPDGRRIVTGSRDRTVRLWNTDGTGEPLVLRGHENTITSVAFSPDGRRVVSGSEDTTARLWDATATTEPLVLRGHEHWVRGVAWSPDGSTIATASQDGTVRLWRADGAGEPLILRHEAPVDAVAFSPDGKRLLTGAGDNNAWVWSDLEPLRGPDDPKLWAATTYCLPAERRVALLNTPEAQAREDEAACRRRVVGGRAATHERP